MTRIMTAGLLMGTITALPSCMKSEIRDVPPPVTTVPAGNLARIEWDNGVTGYFDYKTGNELSSIQYNFGGSTGKTVFEWAGGKMLSVADDRSLYKNVYHYGSDSKLTFTQSVLKQGTSAISTQLEYTYNLDGLVDSMMYYTINEAGKTLKTRSGYSYSPAGELTEVNTISGDNGIRTLVEAWSPEVQFSPQMYLDVSLSENYVLYNLPVLAQSDKLPAKITRMVKSGVGNFATDKIDEVAYTLTGSKIGKSITTITFPAVPGSNTTLEANYFYKE